MVDNQIYFRPVHFNRGVIDVNKWIGKDADKNLISYLNNLRRRICSQIYQEIISKQYTLKDIITSGILDDFGCLVPEVMKEYRERIDVSILDIIDSKNDDPTINFCRSCKSYKSVEHFKNYKSCDTCREKSKRNRNKKNKNNK